MKIFFLTSIVCFILLLLFYYWLNKRQQRQLCEENVVRERLGLPPLTRSQYSIIVVEKSEDFRANINQHM